MTTLWGTTLAASVGCYGLKLAGVSLPGSLLGHPKVQRIAGLLPIAMLSALVVTDLFDANQHYSVNWHTPLPGPAPARSHYGGDAPSSSYS